MECQPDIGLTHIMSFEIYRLISDIRLQVPCLLLIILAALESEQRLQHKTPQNKQHNLPYFSDTTGPLTDRTETSNILFMSQQGETFCNVTTESGLEDFTTILYDEPIARFGQGEKKQIQRIEVLWPDKTQSVYRGPFQAGSRYQIVRGKE